MTSTTGQEHRIGRRRRRGFGAVGAALLLVACTADATDFRRSAEKFIEGDTMSGQADTAFTQASCAQPGDTERGTQFDCTATAADGAEWHFQVTIVDEENFEITGRPVTA